MDTRRLGQSQREELPLRQYTVDPRTYELMTVLSPDVPEEDIAGILDAISGYVTDAGGTVQEVLQDSPWGRRRLAYPIRHAGRDVRDGFYTLYHLVLAPNRVADVERDLKLNTQIIPYLVTHYTPKPIDPRAQIDAEIDAEEAAATAYAAAQAATQSNGTGPATASAGEETADAPAATDAAGVAQVAAGDEAAVSVPSGADGQGAEAALPAPASDATSNSPVAEADAIPGSDDDTRTGEG